MTTPDIAGLCKRLRRPGRNTCGMETNNPVNPDGPEAANTLERQAAEIERLRGALSDAIGTLASISGLAQSATKAAVKGLQTRAALTGEDT